MPLPLKVLIVDDSAQDAELLAVALKRAGFEPEWQRVEEEAEFLRELDAHPDLILSDYRMPKFGGPRALALFNQSGLEIPFIIVSGTIGEETAVEAIKQGAADYLLKDRLARLGPAIHQALERSRGRRERKDAENALRETEGRLRLFSENSPAVIFMKDVEGRYLLVNRLFERQFGLARGNVLGKKDADIFPVAQAQAFQDSDRHVIQSGSLLQFEEDAQTASGRQTSIVSKFPLRDGEGRITGICGIATDITERKRVEAELLATRTTLQTLFDSAPVAIVGLDLEGRIMKWNACAFRIFGWTEAEVLGQVCPTFPTARTDEFRALIARVVREGPQTGMLIRQRTRGGATIQVGLSASPIRDLSGHVSGVMAIFEDLSEYRRLEGQIRQAQKLEALGTMAAGLAHDFNNILGAIRGYTEIARMILVENPPVHEHLGAVLKATERAAHLVKQMLTFSRQQPQELRPVRLAPVVTEALQLLRATVPASIEFEASLAADTPTVLADTTQIHQVLMNLGTNAWHAMKDRPGRLRVTLERCAVDAALAATQRRLRPGLYARITVSDTGCGMDEATQRRMFEPFFTTKGPGEGTGLGLAVVHGIMENHDGAITVYSQPGEGTVFHLYFPAYGGDLAETATEPPAPRPR
ncbi:MAG TPA: PAS domain S-box protein [Opitutaceae bacterium]|jgi:PAS domain S-box-containing protein|nr:PAS domain S-box protein [Opitutaceae bacterium]